MWPEVNHIWAKLTPSIAKVTHTCFRPQILYCVVELAKLHAVQLWNGGASHFSDVLLVEMEI